MTLSSEELERASGFFRAHIQTSEQIRVLRLLAGASGRSWTAAAIAHELGRGAPEAARALDHLCARNLLDIRIGAELNFRYSPGSEDLRLQAEAFLRVLDKDPVVLAQWMADHQREREQSGALRAFVDAFLLRGPGRYG